MTKLRQLWMLLSKRLFIVALHLERIEDSGKRTTVHLGIYHAASNDEALGKAIREHATEEWMLGAWRVGDLFAMLFRV